MFRNVVREMAVRRLSSDKLGKELGISGKTVRNKLENRTKFNIDEMIKIQQLFGGGMTLDELFQWVEG